MPKPVQPTFHAQHASHRCRRFWHATQDCVAPETVTREDIKSYRLELPLIVRHTNTG